jgi:hypothetical protein
LIEIADNSEGRMEVYCARPMYVVANNVAKTVLGSYAIGVDVLAAALIDTVSSGSEIQTLVNADLVTRGRNALKATD